MKMKFSRKNKEDNTDWSELKTCKNCGHVDSGHYCSNCGQHFKEITKPFKEIIWDLLGAISLDNTIFRTIRPFLFKPGFITSEYLAGRRKKYTSPIRLYLFLSIIFFFLAHIGSNRSADSAVKFDQFLTLDSAQIVVGNDTVRGKDIRGEIADQTPVINLDSLIEAENGGSEKLLAYVIKTLQNKSLFLNNLLNNISYALFILMPLFALILQLLYIRRKHFYVEHLIFTLNMHSFALFILSFIFIMKIILKGDDNFLYLLIFLIPVYFTAGIKRFYHQGIFKTILKEFILTFLYGILLLAALTGLAVLTMYRL